MRYLVIGAAGHAQEVAWSLREQARAVGRSVDLRFFDDCVPPGPLPSGLGSVMGDLDDVAEAARGDVAQLVLGIGAPRTKAAVVARLGHLDLPWATVVHPAAVVGPQVRLGAGSYVAAGAVLTVGVRVGRFVTVNVHCALTHDDVVHDFATLHPDVHLAGGVDVAEGAEIGTGACAIPGVAIGAWAVLGAGAAAVRDLEGGRTYVGLPAHAVTQAPRRVRAAGAGGMG
jgi:sugar O-acyltransferase (sialic acid O-acetyltransferase NeuD family)